MIEKGTKNHNKGTQDMHYTSLAKEHFFCTIEFWCYWLAHRTLIGTHHTGVFQIYVLIFCRISRLPTWRRPSVLTKSSTNNFLHHQVLCFNLYISVSNLFVISFNLCFSIKFFFFCSSIYDVGLQKWCFCCSGKRKKKIIANLYPRWRKEILA